MQQWRFNGDRVIECLRLFSRTTIFYSFACIYLSETTSDEELDKDSDDEIDNEMNIGVGNKLNNEDIKQLSTETGSASHEELLTEFLEPIFYEANLELPSSDRTQP